MISSRLPITSCLIQDTLNSYITWSVQHLPLLITFTFLYTLFLPKGFSWIPRQHLHPYFSLLWRLLPRSFKLLFLSPYLKFFLFFIIHPECSAGQQYWRHLGACEKSYIWAHPSSTFLQDARWFRFEKQWSTDFRPVPSTIPIHFYIPTTRHSPTNLSSVHLQSRFL